MLPLQNQSPTCLGRYERPLPPVKIKFEVIIHVAVEQEVSFDVCTFNAFIFIPVYSKTCILIFSFVPFYFLCISKNLYIRKKEMLMVVKRCFGIVYSCQVCRSIFLFHFWFVITKRKDL